MNVKMPHNGVGLTVSINTWLALSDLPHIAWSLARDSDPVYWSLGSVVVADRSLCPTVVERRHRGTDRAHDIWHGVMGGEHEPLVLGHPALARNNVVALPLNATAYGVAPELLALVNRAVPAGVWTLTEAAQRDGLGALREAPVCACWESDILAAIVSPIDLNA